MSTKYLAAYALASLAHPNPSQAEIEKICKAVHAEVDHDTLNFVLESIDGRDVASLVAAGAAKMSSMTVSASAGGAAASGAAAAGGASAAPAAEAKKEEEKHEEEDDDMGFGLFD